MKKITRILTLLSLISVFAITESKAQDIYVSARMNRPSRYEGWERHHPRRPSARHVWVAEEWNARGNSYAYAHGYWAVPPRNGAYWVAGHWKKRGYKPGYYWARGHWG